MITVVLPTHDSAARLVHVLPLLVPAAVDGLVKAVVFADAGSTDATLAIAEDSGARVVQASGDAGAAPGGRLRGGQSAWILALGEDLILPEAWRTPVEAHLAGGGGKPAFIASPRAVRSAPWRCWRRGRPSRRPAASSRAAIR
jgi:glycosyltransferase involved in cell wall biosynthesis